MTKQDVEMRTGIREDLLSAIEVGLVVPTGDQLLILAELFRVDFKFFLSNERKAPFEQTEILYRKHGQHLAAQDRWAIQDMLFFCENEAFLQEALGRKVPTFSLPEPKGTYFKGQGQTAAEQVRAALGLGEKEIPVHVFRLFRSLGIHIFRHPLTNSNVSGLFIKHPVAGLCVLINYSEDQYRQRFTVCHEVAHALLDSQDDEPTISLVSEGKDRRELRANSFAGAFLVPRAAIANISLNSLSVESFVGLCQRLMVNAKTLLITLQEVNGASHTELEKFENVRIPRLNKPDSELGPDLSSLSLARRQSLLEKGLSYPYLRLCFDAYREGKISIQRLTEVLLLDMDETTRLMASYGEAVVNNY